MKRTFRHIAIAVCQIALVMLVAVVWQGIFDVLFAAPLALAAVTGSLTGAGAEADGPDSHRVPSVTDMITRLDSSSFPFTTLLDRTPRVGPTKQVVHRWGEVSQYPRVDTVNGAVVAGGAGASITLAVDNGGNWRPFDIFMAPDNATSPGLMFFISAVSGANLTVYALPASSGSTPYTGDTFGTVPAFADAESIYWVTNMKTEAGTASLPRQMVPAYKFNFVQTIDQRVEWSDHKTRSQNFGQQDQDRQRRENLIEFRRNIEYPMIFNGAPSVTTNPDTSEEQWSMGGLRYFINSTISLPSTGGVESDLVSFLYEGFVGDNGSPRKLLMGGSDFLEVIDKVGADATALSTTRAEKIAGVEIKGLDGRVGQLDTIYHPGFDEQGRAAEAVIVDLNHVVKRDYQAMERRVVDLKRSGEMKDAETEYYIVKTTLEVRNSAAHRWCTLS